MEHVGQVYEINDENGTAVIKVKRHSTCKSCGGCGILTSGEDNEMSMEVPNPVGAKVGEFVRISVETQKVILASLIVYVLPVLVLVVAMYITQQVAFSRGLEETAEVISIGVGLGAMALFFLTLRLLDKRIARTRKFKPQITEVVPEEEMETCVVDYTDE